MVHFFITESKECPEFRVTHWYQEDGLGLLYDRLTAIKDFCESGEPLNEDTDDIRSIDHYASRSWWESVRPGYRRWR